MEKNSNLWDSTSGADGAASSHRTLASASPARLKWVARAAVVLAVLGLHYYIDSQPNLSGSDDPFSKVPDGGVGGMSLFPCADGLECGYINVPKNYFNESDGIANVAFARAKGANQPAKGSIMLNPGGPGGSGIDYLVGAHDRLRLIFGDDWDIVGFDPRGIGRTRPQTKCFPDTITHQLLYANTPFEQAYTVPNMANLSDPMNHLALTEQSRLYLALAEARAGTCEGNMDVEDLKFMGTSTVVRDMDFLTQKLDGKGAKINYHGGSYGSILGAYLVNMLPDRIGYSVIDGIADPITWANEPSHRWHTDWTSSAEKTYQWFLRDCSEAGPTWCPLAKHVGEDPAAIEDRLEAFFQHLVTKPLATHQAGRPGFITSGGARGVLLVALQVPLRQPAVSRALAEAAAGNGTSLLGMIQTPYTQSPGHGGDVALSRLGVTCADSPFEPVPNAEDLAEELMTGLEKHGRFAVSPIFTEPDGGCQFWPTRGRAPERLTGPWNASLEYPLLIISNTADPVTPIASGLLINKNMPHSSRLVIQNGPGHCSSKLPSLCTIKVQQQYWAGNPPKNGTWCEVSMKAFPINNETSTATSTTIDVLSVEDEKLLKAAAELGEIMQDLKKPSSFSFGSRF